MKNHTGEHIGVRNNATHILTNNQLKIGISGKRHIHERNKVYKEIKEMITTILKKWNTTKFVGYTALATGADTIFAEVVKKEFNQPLHIVIPFNLDEYKQDFEGGELEIFENFISEAGQFDIAEHSAPTDKNTRNAAYFKAGKLIADECDEMVMVWDGLKPGGIGGTAEILGYMSEKKSFRNAALIKVRPAKPDLFHEELKRKFERANNFAIKARDKYKRVWKWAIFLGWMTVACFACKIAFHVEAEMKILLTSLEFIFVVSVYILIFLAKKNNYHRHYLHERLKAETFRLFQSFYHASVKIEISDQSKEDETLVASTAQKLNEYVASGEGKSKWYTQFVIKNLIYEQCDYHENKVKSIGNNQLIFERINLFVGTVFIANLALHLTHLILFRNEHSESFLEEVSVFFNILLPASYAALEGFIYFHEWGLLKKYSCTAQRSLIEAKKLLPNNLEQYSYSECHEKQAQSLHLISSIMLTDNKNWNLLLENKDNYHLIV